jgi:hypothetical protein
MCAAALLIAQPAAAAYNVTAALNGVYYSKVAYCDHSAISNWQCGEQCQYFSGIKNVTVAWDNKDEAQGFVAFNAAHNQIALAFRGSHNIANWIEDFTFELVQYPGAPDGCKVHKGFYESYMAMRQTLMPVVLDLARHHPTASIFVAGHSQGAAQSQFAFMDVLAAVPAHVEKTLYNFGQPRVGNPTFAKWAEGRLPAGAHFRAVHNADPVPHLPLVDMGYLHYPREVWYNKKFQPLGYKVCAGTGEHEDRTCSDSVFLPLDVEDHLWYLGVRMECT